MELKIMEFTPPAVEFNFEELQTWVTEGIEKYEKYNNLVMDQNAVKTGKADRAELNKVKKALNDERIRQEKVYMQPFNDFKDKVNSLIRLIDKPVMLIDSKIKEYEAAQKEEKKKEIKNIYKELSTECAIPVPLEKIWTDKWLNASTKIASIKDEICERITQINTDLEAIRKLPDFAFEAEEYYKRTLNLSNAIAEGQRLADIQHRKEAEEAEKARRKAEAKINEEIKKEEAVSKEQPERKVKTFSVLVSRAELRALNDFLRDNHISFKEVR